MKAAKKKENLICKIDRIISDTPVLEFCLGGLIGVIFTTFFYLSV